MWAANSSATRRAAAVEREESAERVRIALGLTLANQLARGCDPDELIVEEYRAALRDSRASRADHSYDAMTADADGSLLVRRGA